MDAAIELLCVSDPAYHITFTDHLARIHILPYNHPYMHPNRMLRELLEPSIMSGSVYVFVTVAILIASTASSLVDQFTIPDNRYYFGQLIHQYSSDAFGRIDNVGPLASVTAFLVWAGAGAIVYVVVWLFINAYIALHNDVVIGTTYTSSGTHGRAKYWGELAARGLFRGCAMILMLLVVAGVVQVWFPLSIDMFKVWSGDFSVPISWLYVVEAFAGWMIVLHVLVILLRLVFLRTRVFGVSDYT